MIHYTAGVMYIINVNAINGTVFLLEKSLQSCLIQGKQTFAKLVRPYIIDFEPRMTYHLYSCALHAFECFYRK